MPVFVFSGSLTRSAPNYGGANGKGITTFVFDEQSGALTPVALFEDIDDSSWLTLDVARRRLHAICEVPGTDQSAVTSFTVDAATGRLDFMGRQSTGGQTACHASFTPDGRHLLVANYNAVVSAGQPDGALAIFPVAADGSLAPASDIQRHTGSGPNRQRQARSHAHCAVVSPDGRFAYVADLGIDRVALYALDGGHATRRPEGDLVVPPGLGPRHLVISAAGDRLFMVSELIASVVSASIDRATGALAALETFTIPSRDGGVVQPSGILVTADGRHLFAELRQSDDIIGLAIESSVARRQTGRWPSGGATPRDFVFSLDGRHLLVANQDSDRISVFAVDPAAGTLAGPLHQIAVGTPMALAIGHF